MKYILELNDRPFNAIAAGTKKVEGRVPTEWDKTPFNKLTTNDTIEFFRKSDKKKMEVKIKYVHHYPDTRSMLKAEGIENIISSEPKTIEHGIESYNLISNYKENIPLYGIYAIGVEPLS